MTGHWTEIDDIVWCDRCWERPPLGFTGTFLKTQYCPNCGVYMENASTELPNHHEWENIAHYYMNTDNINITPNTTYYNYEVINK